MARQKIQKIYVSRLDIFDLGVFIATSHLGVVRIGLTLENPLDPVEFFTPLFSGVSIIHNPRKNIPIANGLTHVLQGRDWDQGIPLDFRPSPFQFQVLKAISRIPFGEIRTYGEVATMVGKPRAPRAVGQALKANPLPLIFP